MYGNVKALLENEYFPERYPLDMETSNKEYLNINNPIERYFIYKSGNIDKQSVYRGAVRYRESKQSICQSIVDCDSCDLIRDVYSLLWSDAIADSENSTIDGQHGETMTSLQHSLNLAVKRIETEEERKSRGRRKVSLAYQIELLSCEKNFLARASEINGLESFALMYHTLGNMIPVPPMFNSSRSNFGTDDYWDITLTKIKKWYDTDDNAVIAELLHKKVETDQSVECCVKWLSWFGGWPNFIEKNYLGDFVEGQNTEPIRFKPNSADDIESFFEVCSCLINKRGQRMVNELKRITA